MEKTDKAMSDDDKRSAAALPRGANVSRAYGAEDEGRAVSRIESCAGRKRRSTVAIKAIFLLLVSCAR